MKPYSALAVANEFIDLAGKNHDVTPMKLMKLVYFAHAWNLGFIGDPLIDEEFQAWRYGPVSPSLYQAVKGYGDDPVTELLYIDKDWDYEPLRVIPKVDSDDSESREIIGTVWQVYGSHSAARLSQITHELGTPWRQIYDSYNGLIPYWKTIPDNMIKQYYSEKAKESAEE